MTTYQGGKKRIGKKIHDVICIVDECINKEKLLPYFEPFVGMGGVLRHFGKEGDRDLYASDINKDLILMWNALKRGWKPPLKCSEKKYNELKHSSKHSAERAFIGTVASYGGIFFQNYRLKYEPQHKDFMREGYNGLMDILPDIKKVRFQHGCYSDYECDGLLIYCDPPYKGNNLSNKLFTEFDHREFWETIREWSKKNLVFISESTAPKDFRKIWSKESHCSNQSKTKRYIDNLYIHNSTYQKLDKPTLKALKNFMKHKK